MAGLKTFEFSLTSNGPVAGLSVVEWVSEMWERLGLPGGGKPMWK